MLLELVEVSFLEPRPFAGLVAEPFPQVVARGDFFEPEVDLGLVFAQSPRPEPVDQDPEPVLSGRRIIDPLDRDRRAAAGRDL
jgi:hypothetical protein